MTTQLGRVYKNWQSNRRRFRHRRKNALRRGANHRQLNCETLEDRCLLSIVGKLFVDAEASGAGTGECWNDAYTDLQAALATARTLNTDGNSDNDIGEIWDNTI